jgi:class 3 adenylate cyclase
MGTQTAQPLEDWSRFLPGALVEWGGPAGKAWADPPREAQVGALMITDVSGFTRLTAKLSRESGQAGAEKISLVLNEFVAKLVATVERLGGAILNFEGDSLVAGRKSEPGDASALGSAVWTSCHCALSLEREIGQTTIEDETLSLRSGVAAGTTYLVHLLSRSANRRIILAGPSMSEVSRCAALAESGETLVSLQAWSYVSKHAKGRPIETGPLHLIDVESLRLRTNRDPRSCTGLIVLTSPAICHLLCVHESDWRYRAG